MQNNRDYIYDYLRVLSCFFICCFHCSGRLLTYNKFSVIWWEHNVITAIVITGLVLFVFISGALILNKKPEHIGHFYIKRFVSVVVPFLVYSYIYLWINKYNFNFDLFLPSNFFYELYEICLAPVNYHLWFIYMIIGIYLFAPFLKKMLQNLDSSECKYLLVLLYFVSFIKYFLPSFGIKIGINNLLIVDWIIPFVLGYLSTKDFINEYYKLIYAFGILSFFFLIFATRFLPDFKNLHDLAPTMLFQTQAIFIFFIRNRKKICANNLINKFMKFVSYYSYEIYLIHALILDFLQIHIFYNVCFINETVNLFIGIILTFTLSFLCAFVINHCIIIYLKKAFYYFVDILKKINLRV